MKVDFADRELSPNGGMLPEDFAAYLQHLCSMREAEGYYLVAVLPGPMTNGEVRGAWLFFGEQPLFNQTSSLEAGAAVDLPDLRPGLEA